MAILGLLGVQAALFSPSKYGILPEILPHEKLSSGNGLLEMWSNLALIGGTVAGRRDPLVDGRTALARGPGAHGRLGGRAARGVRRSPGLPAARPEGNLLETLSAGWSAIRADRILRLAICGQVFVWSIASLIPPPLLAHAMKNLGLPEWQTGLPLAAIGIGIGVGSVAAGRLSAPKVEYGLVPLGAIGLTLSTLVFGLIGPGFAGTMLLMALIGFSAGLVFVPLNALIQWRAPADRRGAVIALANVLSTRGMLVGSAVALVLAAFGVLGPGHVPRRRGGPGRRNALGSLGVPDAFLRFVLILLAGTLYRLRVAGPAQRAHRGARAC